MPGSRKGRGSGQVSDETHSASTHRFFDHRTEHRFLFSFFLFFFFACSPTHQFLPLSAHPQRNVQLKNIVWSRALCPRVQMALLHVHYLPCVHERTPANASGTFSRFLSAEAEGERRRAGGKRTCEPHASSLRGSLPSGVSAPRTRGLFLDRCARRAGCFVLPGRKLKIFVSISFRQMRDNVNNVQAT